MGWGRHDLYSRPAQPLVSADMCPTHSPTSVYKKPEFELGQDGFGDKNKLGLGNTSSLSLNSGFFYTEDWEE